MPRLGVHERSLIGAGHPASRQPWAGSTRASEASSVGRTLPTGANDIDFDRTIDRYSSAGPIHLQLRKLLEEEIASGRLRQGERLPSEPSLSAQYQISRTTVRLALSALEQEGLIRKEKGRGAFVSTAAPRSWLLQSVGGLFYDELTRHGITISSTVVKSAVEALPDWAADSLQLQPGAKGVTLERVRHLNGEVAIYVINYLPERYADVLGEIWGAPTASLYGLLGERYGVVIAGSSRLLEAVGAPAGCASRLEVRRGSPVAFIQSVSWDGSSTPVDCFRAWLRTDRLKISVESQARESAAGRVVSHSLGGVLGPDADWGS